MDREALAVVAHAHDEVVALEPQLDLEVTLGSAVAHGVRHGLFHGEDDVVDGVRVDALLGEVVADPLAGAQETRGLQRQPERQPRLRALIEVRQEMLRSPSPHSRRAAQPTRVFFRTPATRPWLARPEPRQTPDRGGDPAGVQGLSYSPLITKNDPRIVPASRDFWRANLNASSSLGTSIPWESLKPTARFLGSSIVYRTLTSRPSS